MRALVPAILCIVLASCGASKQRATIAFTSSAFQNGQRIPTQYSCDGANQAPPLSWGDPPKGTKSFALVINDPDAPGGTFRHWGVYAIPASAHSIGQGQNTGAEVINDKGLIGYTGPCPPPGNGLHHYHFKLFALNVDRLRLPSRAKVIDVENAAAKHAIAQGELIGTYERR
jgi:Raf kinase inhibitor-like YbhB/YbcL family protein